MGNYWKDMAKIKNKDDDPYVLPTFSIKRLSAAELEFYSTFMTSTPCVIPNAYWTLFNAAQEESS